MTNEEAIVYLERADTTVYKEIKTKTAEALEMAIKVLEQQQDVHDTCKKCIEFSEFKQPSEMHCEFSDENVAKAFIEDVEAVKDKLPKSSEDCRNCKKWNKCPCGKEGHENGTSIGYSIGECKDYEPCEDCISRDDVDAYIAKLMSGYLYDEERARLEEFSAYLWELPPVTPRMNLAETSQDCISIEPIQWYSQNKDGYLVKGAYSKDEAYVKLTDVYEKIRISEDCISREEALLALTGRDLPTDRDKLIALFTERIQHLSPVTPQRPKGKWIKYEVDIAPHPLHCSLCGFSNHHINNRYMREFRLCPDCGAEMSGGGEDENSN